MRKILLFSVFSFSLISFAENQFKKISYQEKFSLSQAEVQSLVPEGGRFFPFFPDLLEEGNVDKNKLFPKSPKYFTDESLKFQNLPDFQAYDLNLRLQIINKIAEANSKTAQQVLKNLFQSDQTIEVRIAILEATFANNHKLISVADIQKLLKDKNNSLRFAAISALFQYQEVKIDSLLLLILTMKDEEARSNLLHRLYMKRKNLSGASIKLLDQLNSPKQNLVPLWIQNNKSRYGEKKLVEGFKAQNTIVLVNFLQSTGQLNQTELNQSRLWKHFPLESKEILLLLLTHSKNVPQSVVRQAIAKVERISKVPFYFDGKVSAVEAYPNQSGIDWLINYAKSKETNGIRQRSLVALVNISKRHPRLLLNQMDSLLSSDDAGYRELGLQVLIHNNLVTRYKDEIISLFKAETNSLVMNELLELENLYTANQVDSKYTTWSKSTSSEVKKTLTLLILAKKLEQHYSFVENYIKTTSEQDSRIEVLLKCGEIDPDYFAETAFFLTRQVNYVQKNIFTSVDRALGFWILSRGKVISKKALNWAKTVFTSQVIIAPKSPKAFDQTNSRIYALRLLLESTDLSADSFKKLKSLKSNKTIEWTIFFDEYLQQRENEHKAKTILIMPIKPFAAKLAIEKVKL
ncbi:MAG: hypothetical protein MK193_01120 [Lentisphaeria bacterium]|nr:hypothetical protein [Lentisphaeria bacterium]